MRRLTTLFNDVRLSDRVRGLARWQNPVVASPAARAARTRALPPDRGDRGGRYVAEAGVAWREEDSEPNAGPEGR